MRFFDRLGAALLAYAVILAPLGAQANDLNQSTWSETDNSNNATSPNGWASGTMLPSQVEPTARAMMGAIKRWYDHAGPTVTSGGTANAQTLTYSSAPAAYVTGDTFVFKAGFTNTGATTINVNGLGATAVNTNGGTLTGGEIQSGQVVVVAYDGTVFQLVATSGSNAGVKVCMPQTLSFSTGSGTYTVPSCNGVTAPILDLELVGAGASGASSGTAATASGNAGGNSTFGTRTANGGTGGVPGNSTGIASGGGTSGCVFGFAGNPGAPPSGGVNNIPGGMGGSTLRGTAGSGGNAGSDNAAPGSNGGGGGGGGGGTSFQGAGGGGAGGYCKDTITSPSATYAYAVGSGGAQVAAGSGGGHGGAGGNGFIKVTARWQ